MTFRVDIEARTGDFRREMQRSERAVQSFGNVAGRAATAARSLGVGLAAIGGGAVVAGLTRLVRGSAEFGAQLERQSQLIGFTVEQLQELRGAGESVGVAFRGTDIGLQRFARRVAQAADGAGELAKVFEEQQIAARDASGALRPLPDILDDYADAIGRADSEQEALLLGFKAFDTEGARFALALRGGSEGLDALRAAAREAGIVLNEEAVALERIQQTLEGLSTAFTVEVARVIAENAESIEVFTDSLLGLVNVIGDRGPLITDFLSSYVATLQQLDQLDGNLGRGLGRALRDTQSGAAGLAPLREELAPFGDVLRRMAEGVGLVDEAFDGLAPNLTNVGGRVGEVLGEIRTGLQGFTADTSITVPLRAFAVDGPVVQTVVAGTETIGQSFDALADSLAGVTGAATADTGVGALAMQLDLVNEAIATGVPGLTEARDRIADLLDVLTSSVAIDGELITTPIELLETNVGESTDAIARHVEDMQNRIREALRQIADEIRAGDIGGILQVAEDALFDYAVDQALNRIPALGGDS